MESGTEQRRCCKSGCVKFLVFLSIALLILPVPVLSATNMETDWIKYFIIYFFVIFGVLTIILSCRKRMPSEVVNLIREEPIYSIHIDGTIVDTPLNSHSQQIDGVRDEGPRRVHRFYSEPILRHN